MLCCVAGCGVRSELSCPRLEQLELECIDWSAAAGAGVM